MKLHQKSKGFTLIELLVVIAIIGILSSVVLVSLNSARAKARDAQRVTALNQLKTALDLYYADNGAYPTTAGWSSGQSECAQPVFIASNGVYIQGLAPKYIASLPLDPKLAGQLCGYMYLSNGVDYYLMAWQSYEGTAPVGHVNASGDVHSYGVWTPGAATWY